MKQKDILLWMIAVGGLVLSLFNLLGPELQGMSSEAAMQSSRLQAVRSQATTINVPSTSAGSEECESLKAALVEAQKTYEYYDLPQNYNEYYLDTWGRIIREIETQMRDNGCSNLPESTP